LGKFSILTFTTLSPNFKGCLLSSLSVGSEELLTPQICTPSIDVSSCSWDKNKYKSVSLRKCNFVNGMLPTTVTKL
jgi:hypothetical protein